MKHVSGSLGPLTEFLLHERVQIYDFLVITNDFKRMGVADMNYKQLTVIALFAFVEVEGPITDTHFCHLRYGDSYHSIGQESRETASYYYYRGPRFSDFQGLHSAFSGSINIF